MVSLITPTCDFNAPAADFALPGVDGQIHTLQSCRGACGILVMFICNHCPYVKAIRERLVQTCKDLESYGIRSVAISSNDPTDYPEDDFEHMRAYAKAYGFEFPYLFDETQEVARAYGALCTPDFFGYNADMQLQYRGRLDASGRKPAAPSAPRDLFLAMTQIAMTGKGPTDQIPSTGCSIKWRSSFSFDEV